MLRLRGWEGSETVRGREKAGEKKGVKGRGGKRMGREGRGGKVRGWECTH